MAENEVTVENVAPQPEKKKRDFKAGLKEWFRKKAVSLKRAPQRIPLVMLVISTCLWLIWLFTFSRTIYANQAVNWCGLMVFINTLLSILILALFSSAFPKRKKPNYIFIGLLFAFMAVIIVCDVMYYVEMKGYLFGDAGYSQAQLDAAPFMEESLTLSIVHIVLICVCAVLLATLPLYKKLILKINTRKEVAGTEIKEKIDVEED